MCFHLVFQLSRGLSAGMALIIFNNYLYSHNIRPYGDRPAARYGHSANVISKKAFVVFGGKGEEVYNDVYPHAF